MSNSDEAALKSAVATFGLISVSIDASHRSFQLYHSGADIDTLCGKYQEKYLQIEKEIEGA